MRPLILIVPLLLLSGCLQYNPDAPIYYFPPPDSSPAPMFGVPSAVSPAPAMPSPRPYSDPGFRATPYDPGYVRDMTRR